MEFLSFRMQARYGQRAYASKAAIGQDRTLDTLYVRSQLQSPIQTPCGNGKQQASRWRAMQLSIVDQLGHCGAYCPPLSWLRRKGLSTFFY
jgi:hypothetical protein